MLQRAKKNIAQLHHAQFILTLFDPCRSPHTHLRASYATRHLLVMLSSSCFRSVFCRVDKKRDRQERQILDSQERAFWDVHRPVPGCVNTTEVDFRKLSRSGTFSNVHFGKGFFGRGSLKNSGNNTDYFMTGYVHVYSVPILVILICANRMKSLGNCTNHGLGCLLRHQLKHSHLCILFAFVHEETCLSVSFRK